MVYVHLCIPPLPCVLLSMNPNPFVCAPLPLLPGHQPQVSSCVKAAIARGKLTAHMLPPGEEGGIPRLNLKAIIARDECVLFGAAPGPPWM